MQTLLEMFPGASGEVVVTLGDDELLKELNSTYRSVDEATDVLTFLAPEHVPGVLGDVIVSMDFAARHARIRKVRLVDELAMLAVHGGLHLMGFDDQSDEDREIMVAKMNEVMLKAGLPSDEDWHSLPHQVGADAIV
ncbi:rRNA maturation RNase YbeY [Kamptonema cortianum]|nr:rRNA maturation RNase YbeY [Kamptonema cortianum]